MIGSIYSKSFNCCHTCFNYLTHPYLEGFEKLKLAWKGKENLSSQQIRLSLKERMISVIQGTLLMIPVINMIVSIAMKRFEATNTIQPSSSFLTPTFIEDEEEEEEEEILPTPTIPPGIQTESLSSVPEITQQSIAESQVIETSNTEQIEPQITSPIPQLPKPTTVVTAPKPPSNIKTEHHVYDELVDEVLFKADWNIKITSKKIQVIKNSGYSSSKSHYDLNWNLKDLTITYHTKKEQFTFIVENNKVQATKVNINKNKTVSKIIEIPENYTLIQQPLLGLRPFIQSSALKMDCCLIDDSLDLQKGYVEKIGYEEKANLLLRKIKSICWYKMASLVPSLPITMGYVWADEKIGIVRELEIFKRDTPVIPHTIDTFVPPNP